MMAHGLALAFALVVASTAQAGPDWAVVRKGDPLDLNCPDEPLRRVPGGPKSGPPPVGE